jgi:ATP-dependent DNA helicase RecG
MELEKIKGVGPKMKQTLANLNIHSLQDLLEYYPYRYNFVSYKNLNELETEIGYLGCMIITDPKVFYIKKNFNKLSFVAEAFNTNFNVVIFNRAFMKNNLKPNKEIVLLGKYDKLKNTFTASDIKFNLPNNTIEPVYHLTSGVTSNALSKLIKEGFNQNTFIDTIPEEYNEKYNLISKYDATRYIHFPKSVQEIKQAKLKLIYEEFFRFMFKINYLKITEKKALGIKRDVKDDSKFFELLPFKLTKDQETTVLEIKQDMTSETRMNRLILGDVGSGKTSVAAYAIYLNYLSSYQTAFMAPTEILAVQHYKSLTKLFKNTDLTIELLTGHMTKGEKQVIYDRLKSGEINLIIGTHALINEEVTFNNLGLVITDEQHRFGVLQRNTLENKGVRPDVLYLSATPIPRTYALTIYGDTDVSIIKTKPVGRKEIITKVYKEKDIKEVLEKIYSEIKNNHQVFVVSPLIENEESDLNSVVILKDKLSSAFKDKSIEIIHGKMKQQEKDAIMNNFVNQKIDILISTTVIEVGIDVPNATVMVIYNAERFGLATLHQLRGRVGRGEDQSYCFLISDFDNKRLKVMEESNDGFYITEKDFEQRREGDLFGTKQSGDMVFKIADIKRDYQILLQTQKDTEEYIKEEKYQNNKYYLQIIDDLKFLN